MQILTDEGVSKSTVKILQELGQTVVRVQELQLEGAGDTMILERSRADYKGVSFL
jgi:predicted nuclease of predicted toxin-antitoxin system